MTQGITISRFQQLSFFDESATKDRLNLFGRMLQLIAIQGTLAKKMVDAMAGEGRWEVYGVGGPCGKEELLYWRVKLVVNEVIISCEQWPVLEESGCL